MSVSEYNEQVRLMRESKIEIIYKVEAYHNETVRTYNEETKSYSSSTHRVETYKEDFVLPIAQAADST